MSRPKSNKPKRNIWTDPSPYGTYEGKSGSTSSWTAAFNTAAYSREKALGILKNFIETPYDILGVSREATLEQIKSAFRKLVIVHHPDKGGDRAMFEKIMAAYSFLISL
jgi:DnaJ-class molecular chaperone